MDYFSTLLKQIFVKEDPPFKKPDGYKNINTSSTQKNKN